MHSLVACSLSRTLRASSAVPILKQCEYRVFSVWPSFLGTFCYAGKSKIQALLYSPSAECNTSSFEECRRSGKFAYASPLVTLLDLLFLSCLSGGKSPGSQGGAGGLPPTDAESFSTSASTGNGPGKGSNGSGNGPFFTCSKCGGPLRPLEPSTSRESFFIFVQAYSK